MKQACLKRVLCYVCCLSLVLGVFAYKPAKAEAVFVSPLAALGASLIASVVVGSTATFFVESGAADAIGTAIDSLLEEYIGTMDELMGYTPQEICEMVGSGATLEGGAIRLSSRAGELTAGFINWLREQDGLEPGGDQVTFGVETGLFSYGGVILPSFPDFSAYVDWNNYLLLYHSGTGIPHIYCLPDSVYLVEDGYLTNTFRETRIYARLIDGVWEFTSSIKSAGVAWIADSSFEDYRWSSFDISFQDGTVKYSGSAPEPVYEEGTEVALQPKPEFQTIPNEIPEGQVLRIDTGLASLPAEDPQAIADAIMGAINAGTLSPSVSIEGQATDIPGTGTDDDTVIAVPGADADLLDWTKYIGQKVASIPKAIGQSVAEAVAAAFSPDPKLVNEITGAFSAKFGFVETLKYVGDDMFGMTAASEPPVVWIHLEDAEGRYDYGGTVKALDMAWYQRYKADVDRILGGFLWLAYLWLLFKRLPDILSGAGMTAAESQYIDDHQLVSGQWIKVRRSKRL